MNVAELQDRERKALKAFKQQAARYRAANPSLTQEGAMAKAIASLGAVYVDYAGIRAQLHSMHVRPIEFSDI
jgi:hypothetical protein